MRDGAVRPKAKKGINNCYALFVSATATTQGLEPRTGGGAHRDLGAQTLASPPENSSAATVIIAYWNGRCDLCVCVHACTRMPPPYFSQSSSSLSLSLSHCVFRYFHLSRGQDVGSRLTIINVLAVEATPVTLLACTIILTGLSLTDGFRLTRSSEPDE